MRNSSFLFGESRRSIFQHFSPRGKAYNTMSNMSTKDSVRRESCISMVSDGSCATESTVSVRQHKALRAECVMLKVELAKTIALSNSHSRHDHAMKNEIELLRNENRHLACENKTLKAKLDNLTGSGSPDEKEDVKKSLNRFRKVLKDKGTLDPNVAFEVIEAMHQSSKHQLSQAADQRFDLEVESQRLADQRNHWKCEAEQLGIELNEMKQRDLERTTQCVDTDIAEWRSMVEQLGVELNETKREKEEVVARMCQKEADMMEMMNQMNTEMNDAAKQKNEEVADLVNFINMYCATAGSKNQMLAGKKESFAGNTNNQYRFKAREPASTPPISSVHEQNGFSKKCAPRSA